jgi:DHA1 family bicyclomycin/chloramphenicol resistance-like MFS transporter
LIPFLIGEETWPEEKRKVKNVLQATLQAFGIIRNRKLLAFIGAAMLITVPLWAYIGVCSYVYYDFFEVSNMEYAVLYASGSLISFTAPFLYMLLSKYTDAKKTAAAAMVMLAAAAVMFGTVGSKSPILFLIAMIPVFLAEGIIRTLGTVEVLNRYRDEAGSASAVFGFAMLIISVPATAIATIGWGSFITGITVITGGSVLAAALLWIYGRIFLD